MNNNEFVEWIWNKSSHAFKYSNVSCSSCWLKFVQTPTQPTWPVVDFHLLEIVLVCSLLVSVPPPPTNQLHILSHHCGQHHRDHYHHDYGWRWRPDDTSVGNRRGKLPSPPLISWYQNIEPPFHTEGMSSDEAVRSQPPFSLWLALLWIQLSCLVTVGSIPDEAVWIPPLSSLWLHVQKQQSTRTWASVTPTAHSVPAAPFVRPAPEDEVALFLTATLAVHALPHFVTPFLLMLLLLRMQSTPLWTPKYVFVASFLIQCILLTYFPLGCISDWGSFLPVQIYVLRSPGRSASCSQYKYLSVHEMSAVLPHNVLCLSIGFSCLEVPGC